MPAVDKRDWSQAGKDLVWTLAIVGGIGIVSMVSIKALTALDKKLFPRRR